MRVRQARKSGTVGMTTECQPVDAAMLVVSKLVILREGSALLVQRQIPKAGIKVYAAVSCRG
jgi:hypothetical protein